jgi:hypothetical protein
MMAQHSLENVAVIGLNYESDMASGCHQAYSSVAAFFGFQGFTGGNTRHANSFLSIINYFLIWTLFPYMDTSTPVTLTPPRALYPRRFTAVSALSSPFDERPPTSDYYHIRTYVL